MVPLFTLCPSFHLPSTIPLLYTPTLFTYPHHSHFRNLRHPPCNPHRFTINSLQNDAYSYPPSNPQPRTLYPGGYKRAEIKVPNFVLQLSADEVLSDGSVLDLVDGAVSKWVGIVMVNGGGGGGGKLYEAACLLKSVIRDRAYLLIAERVDIAAAVKASGVVLSDQGLPAIVARNTMMDSKSDSVVLPVVGRSVQTINAAISASSSEGADFLIFSSVVEKCSDVLMQSLYENVKVPIFVGAAMVEDVMLMAEASKLFRAGASGLAIMLGELKLFGDDILGKLLQRAPISQTENEVQSFDKLKSLTVTNGFAGEMGMAGFVKLEDREMQFIKKERRVLVEAVNAIKKAAPLMEEVSLLNDAISQLDEPFLLVIVGEFNSGKSTVINALLGGRFLKDGVVPTTNEVTFLRYMESDSTECQRCETRPDGQYVCYLPAQILKKMIIVDTPGTNVILQRQQRLTEEFVPRADLLLFVMSADRPLTDSEVAFLRYTQQWKKEVVFMLNKSDLYQSASELEEAVTFVKENVQRLLNIEHVTLYTVSARSALEAKLLSSDARQDQLETSVIETCSRSLSFYEFENFLYGFLDGSTAAGLERMSIKLQTPLGIAERLLSSCRTLLTQDSRRAKQDLASVKELIGSVKDYATRMESESFLWRSQILFLVDTTKTRVLKLVESTVQLSNLDIAASFVLKGDKSASVPATQNIENDIIGPVLLDAQKLLGSYTSWLRTNTTGEAMRYKESFGKKWSSLIDSVDPVPLENALLREVDELSKKAMEKYSASTASQLFQREISEVFLGAFGGLGAAGVSASLLTSVLPTTLEDLLALGLCSAGGFLAISSFPARRQKMADKVKKIADIVGQEIEEAMQKELWRTIENMQEFVVSIGEPYEEAARKRLDKLLETQEDLANVEKNIQSLQIELQNLHIS